MQLNKAQIQQIDNYIKSCGVQWYDVRMELIDHFALAVEENLEENQDIEFKKALNKVHKSFGINGFKNLLATKTKVVEKQFYKSAFKYFVGFFKLPRIILTIATYWGLINLSNIFENRDTFSVLLMSIVLITASKMLVRSRKIKKAKGEKFLKLNQGINYLQIIQGLYIIFNSFISNSNSEKYLTNTYYFYSVIGLYVLLTLFLISCEYVYYHLKQEIKQQFPNLKLAQ